MHEVERLRLYFVLYMCRFYVLNVMIAVCVKRQCYNRTKMVQYDIESTSIRRHKQCEYMNRVVYDSNIKVTSNVLIMDRQCFHNLCQLLTNIDGLHGTRNTMVVEMVRSNVFEYCHTMLRIG